MLKGHAVKRLGKKAAILNLREHIKNKLFLDRTRKDSNFKRPHICATLFQIEKCWRTSPFVAGDAVFATRLHGAAPSGCFSVTTLRRSAALLRSYQKLIYKAIELDHRAVL